MRKVISNQNMVSDITMQNDSDRWEHSDDDYQSEERSIDLTYPHVTLIKELYREMVEQGFYTPHIRTTYKGERKPKHDLAAGTFDVRIKIVMQMDVCL